MYRARTYFTKITSKWITTDFGLTTNINLTLVSWGLDLHEDVSIAKTHYVEMNALNIDNIFYQIPRLQI